VRQVQSVRGLSAIQSTQGADVVNLANGEMDTLFNILWEQYAQLGVPCRALKCSASLLHRSEFAAYLFQVWLPSQHAWLTCGRVSHYADYISKRLGITNYHLVGCDAVSKAYFVLYTRTLSNC